MSEQAPSESNFEDAFDEILSRFEEDRDYANRIEDLNDQIDQNTLVNMFYEQANTDERGPYYLGSVDVELQQVVAGFYGFCEQIGVDISDENCSDEDFDQISDHLALETYNIRDTLKPGDIVSAKNAIITDVEGDGYIFGISEDQYIQGEFVSPIIAYLPDDATLLTYDESYGDDQKNVQPPLGVGLLLKDTFVREQGGENEPYGVPEAMVVIALGTLGLHVDKHYYRSELVISDLPDEIEEI